MGVTASSGASPRSPGSISVAVDDGRVVLRLDGEHDLATQQCLTATIGRAIATFDGDVVVDLSAVEFMDAGIVGVSLRARELLLLRSRTLVLRAPSPPAMRVIGLCGLDDLVEPVSATPV